MADVFTREKRSEIMSRVKGGGNRATELKLIEVFRENGITGWRRNSPIFGKPDFVFPASRTAVFVDGCFWHGCPDHGSMPDSNRAFWERKLAGNVSRDRLVGRELRRRGWKVVRIWQHELKRPRNFIRRLKRALSR